MPEQLDVDRIKALAQLSEENKHNQYRGYEYKDGMAYQTDFYLSTISPHTVLALVAEIERLREELAKYTSKQE